MARTAAGKTEFAQARRYGDWVRRKMEARGWGKSELAIRSGLNREKVRIILGGGCVFPTVDQVRGLCQAFAMTPNQVFRNSGWLDGVEPTSDSEVIASDRFPKPPSFRLGPDQRRVVAGMEHLPPEFRKAVVDVTRTLEKVGSKVISEGYVRP